MSLYRFPAHVLKVICRKKGMEEHSRIPELQRRIATLEAQVQVLQTRAEIAEQKCSAMREAEAEVRVKRFKPAIPTEVPKLVIRPTGGLTLLINYIWRQKRTI